MADIKPGTIFRHEDGSIRIVQQKTAPGLFSSICFPAGPVVGRRIVSSVNREDIAEVLSRPEGETVLPTDRNSLARLLAVYLGSLPLPPVPRGMEEVPVGTVYRDADDGAICIVQRQMDRWEDRPRHMAAWLDGGELKTSAVYGDEIGEVLGYVKGLGRRIGLESCARILRLQDPGNASRQETVFIGLVGAKGAGKSTIAAHLARYLGAERMRLAGPLKEAAKIMCLLSDEQVDGAQKEEVDELTGLTPRHILQRLGTEIGRQLLGEDHWVKVLLKRAEGKKMVIVDDVRFENELRLLKERGAVILGVEGGESGDGHSSEALAANLAEVCDVIVPRLPKVEDRLEFAEALLTKYGKLSAVARYLAGQSKAAEKVEPLVPGATQTNPHDDCLSARLLEGPTPASIAVVEDAYGTWREIRFNKLDVLWLRGVLDRYAAYVAETENS
jgi:energy-coupling factor transporter ATP-binding protein EcfA2